MPLAQLLVSGLLYQYYLRVCTAVGDGQAARRESEAGTIRTVDLLDVGITFGVLDSIFDLVGQRDSDAPRAFADRLRELLSESLGADDPRIFRDGTFFEADWPYEPEMRPSRS